MTAPDSVTIAMVGQVVTAAVDNVSNSQQYNSIITAITGLICAIFGFFAHKKASKGK